MESEVSIATMLGVVLISLAALIGIGFGIFAIIKLNTNAGSAETQSKLAVITEKEFADYDQTTVMGQYAIEALNNFGKRDLAILVATTAFKDCYNASCALKKTDGSELSGVKDAYNIKTNSQMDNFNRNVVKITDGSFVTNNSSNTINGVFVNYNTLLGSGTLTNMTSKKVTYKNGRFVCADGFVSAGSDGAFEKNTVTKNLSRTGMVEYIPVAAKFNSFLITDAGGTIIGIALDQLNN